MSAAIWPPSTHVPTLTEVVVPFPAPFTPPAAASSDTPTAVETGAIEPAPVWTPADQEAVTQRVLADLHKQVDRLFDYRVREAITPAIERLAEALVREVRQELADTLHDIVRRAVAQELARHKLR